MFRFLVVLSLVFLLSACSDTEPGSKLYKIHGKTMGTSYNISLVVDDANSIVVDELQSLIDAQLLGIDSAMSTYKYNSELSLFNRLPIGDTLEVSDSTRTVIDEASRLAAFTDGAFNTTVAPLVDLWGFGGQSEGANMVPGKDQVEQALLIVGMDRFKLRSNLLTKTKSVRIDLSAIAKGYAVDRIASLLKEHGFSRFLVEIGGEIVTSGSSIRNSSWVLGIESPDNGGRSVYTKVYLDEAALATSGDYRNYFEVDGIKYSHTINPKTGWPVKYKLTSVSVVAESCMLADGLATALMVMGEEDGYNFAQKHGISAFFIYREGERLLTRHTKTFEQYLN